MFDLQGFFDSLFSGPLGDLLGFSNPIFALIEFIFSLLSLFGGGA